MAIKIGNISVNSVALGSILLDSVAIGSDVVWEKTTPVVASPLCFTGDVMDSVRLVKVGSPDSANIKYSKDGSNWTAYTFDTWINFDGTDNKVYFRAASDNNTSFYTDENNYYRFELGENYPTTVSGNLDTLLNKNGTRHPTKARTYRELFTEMVGLTDASQLELPSMELPSQCYYGMFRLCTALEQAPELPATTLGVSCYRLMFDQCPALVSAPSVLPATTTQEYCYARMFFYCESLTDAPVISATTLTTNCFQNMFSYDPQLSSVTVLFTDWQADVTPTGSWLTGVASNGKFYCPSELSVIRGASNIPTNWAVNPNALCFTANTANSTIRLDKVGSPNAISLETSTDGTTWTDYGWTDITGDTLTLTNIGDKVYMRAKTENSTIGSSSSNYYQFIGTGSFAASGNIQSLLKADCTRTDVPTYCYQSMFQGCTSLTQAPALPATTLAGYCYSNMFNGCTSLTQAPAILPATTLANNCYRYMFQGCTSLAQAPTLPATTLANNCYQGMFQGCTSLTQAPELPATALAGYCYSNMFNGCASLTQAPSLLATTLTTGCYQFMFNGCASLTQAPALPATTLAQYCYYNMFNGCTHLNSMEVSFTEWTSGATNNWVAGAGTQASGTKTFKCPSTLPQTFGDSNIPTGWTIVTT